MEERNQEVLAKMRELIEKYPELGSRQLYDKATRMDPTLHGLNLRSFHARYVLPIRRERARAEGRMRPRRPRKAAVAPPAAATTAPSDSRPSTGGAAESARARVREILLRYTREIAAAESPAELVDLVGGIDSVVSEILAVG